MFWNVKLRLDTKMQVAVFEENSCQIFDIHKPGYNVDIKIKLFATYTNGTIIFNNEMSFYEQRKILNEVLIRTANTVRINIYRVLVYNNFSE